MAIVIFQTHVGKKNCVSVLLKVPESIILKHHHNFSTVFIYLYTRVACTVGFASSQSPVRVDQWEERHTNKKKKSFSNHKLQRIWFAVSIHPPKGCNTRNWRKDANFVSTMEKVPCVFLCVCLHEYFEQLIKVLGVTKVTHSIYLAINLLFLICEFKFNWCCDFKKQQQWRKKIKLWGTIIVCRLMGDTSWVKMLFEHAICLQYGNIIKV